MATLSTTINSSATAIVASAATHGKKVGDYIAIDSEAMLIEGFGATALDAGAITPQWVTPEDKTKITVARAQLGTTAASHTSGATIASVAPLYGARTSSPLAAGGVIAAGSTRTATSEDEGKTIALDTLTGSVVTLPAASGSGLRLRFNVTAIATSNSHKVQVANASDTMTGALLAVSDDAGFPVKGYTADATAGADTITLNRTTTGSTIKGEWIEVEDVAANKWAVRGVVASTGTEATPFSAAVS